MYTVGPPAVKHLIYRYIIEEEHIFFSKLYFESSVHSINHLLSLLIYVFLKIWPTSYPGSDVCVSRLVNLVFVHLFKHLFEISILRISTIEAFNPYIAFRAQKKQVFFISNRPVLLCYRHVSVPRGNVTSYYLLQTYAERIYLFKPERNDQLKS